MASTFGVGGAERVVSALVDGLAREVVPALCFLREGGTIGRGMLNRGIRGVEHLEKFRGDPGAWLRLLRFFRSFDPHIIYCLDHHNAMLAGRVSRVLGRGRACVVASHSTGLFGRRSSLRWSDRWLAEFTDCFVALSRTHARYLCDRESIDAGRIVIIENGVDVERFVPVDPAGRRAAREALGLDEKDHVAVMVAAMRPEKAHAVAVEAADRVRCKFPTARLVLVGDGPQRLRLEEMVAERGLDSTIRFLGVRDDVARLLHASDVLILPSYDVVETLPLSVMEAMASGIPVIASDVGSVSDLVRPGETGWLVDPGDPGALAQAVTNCFGAPDHAREMGKKGRRRVEEGYTVERMTARYARLFHSLVTS